MKVFFDLLSEFPAPRTKPTNRRPATAFSVSYPKMLEDLQYEIEAISGTAVRLEADFQSKQLRRDGFPYSDASPVSHPGVILSFDIKNGRKTERVSFACDSYSVWWHNLRDISLLLTDLRGVDRRRARSTRDTESGGKAQYEGYAAKQIAAPESPVTDKDESYRAAVLLLKAGKYQVTNASVAALMTGIPQAIAVYKKALMLSHPDQPDGSHEKFLTVQDAARVLGLEK